MQKVLVVGGTGLVGREICDKLQKENISFIGTFSHQKIDGYIKLDLSSAPFDLKFSDFSDVIICAGIAGNNIEKNFSYAQDVNISGTKILIESALKSGCKITFFSSSAVFSANQQGSDERVTPIPATTYGKHKRIIEEYLLSIDKNNESVRILRPTKILSGRTGLLSAWKSGRKISANSSISIAPISATFVASFVMDLMKTKSYGIFHISGSELIDYVNFAKKMVSKFDLVTNSENLEFFEDKTHFQDSATLLNSIFMKEDYNWIQDLDQFMIDISRN